MGGVAQISREATKPSTEFLMAVVGPLSSILLGLLFLGLAYALEPFSVHLSVITRWLFLVNVALGVFNMIPGFPMDGGRVFRAAVWAISGNYARATRIATLGGQGVAVAFVATGLFIFLRGNPLQGMWLTFIALFLWQAASGSFRQFRQGQRLQGYVARDLMSTDCPEVFPGASLRELVERDILNGGWRCFIVAEGGRVQGLIDLQAVKRVAKRAWETTPVAKVMTPLHRITAVAPGDEAYRVLEVLNEGNLGLVPVMDGGEVVGVIGRDRLLQFMGARSR